MNDDRKEHGWAFWVAVALGLPLLYVLSSGPAYSLATHVVLISAAPGATPIYARQIDTWWVTLYSPLIWAAERRWGEPLQSYWALFHLLD